MLMQMLMKLMKSKLESAEVIRTMQSPLDT